jgi:hypothetical protein
MVGERRFELPTSASRTLRANQTALLPVFVLYCNVQRPERCALNQAALRPVFSSACSALYPEVALLLGDNILYSEFNFEANEVCCFDH